MISCCGTLGYTLIDFATKKMELLAASFHLNHQDESQLEHLEQVGNVIGYFLGSLLCLGIFGPLIDIFQTNQVFVYYICLLFSMVHLGLVFFKPISIIVKDKLALYVPPKT